MGNLVDNYGWWLLALVLIAMEMVAPGYFMLWIGIAAGAMGFITLVAPHLSAIVQALVFALLSIAAIWKPLSDYSPAGLAGHAASLAAHTETSSALWPVLSSLVLSVILAAVAVILFRTREL